MKKWISIIALILVVVFASGCTAQSSAKTYSSNNIENFYLLDFCI
jgi:ABC-type molybdate transport system substrate-binding protein